MRKYIVPTLILTVFASASAVAAPITYIFDNVTLTDGQTLTGSLVFDYDIWVHSDASITNSGYSDVSITNSGTALNPATTWNTPFVMTAVSNPFIIASPYSLALTNGPFNATDRVLFLDFDGAMDYPELTDTVRLVRGGHTLFMLCDDSFMLPSNCGDAWGLGGTNALGSVYIASGSLQAVPVPAAAWLFGSAVGVMGVMRRKIGS